MILQGSGHDRHVSPATVTDRIERYVAPLRGGPVAIAGPFWAGGDDPGPVRGSVRAAAESSGHPYIDTAGWVSPELIGPDGAHLTEAGHRAVGEQMARAVLALDLYGSKSGSVGRGAGTADRAEQGSVSVGRAEKRGSQRDEG